MKISLKELKKNRLTPTEKWVLSTIEGVKPETNEYGNVVWRKDGKQLFTQNLKIGCLAVSCYSIWVVLEKEFGLNYNEIQELIKNVMYDYTNNGELTPKYDLLNIKRLMYDYTNKGQLKIALL